MKYKMNDEITFDDGKVYTVIDSIIYDNNNYVYLGYQDENQVPHFLVLKERKENDKCYLVNLDNEEEVDTIISIFSKKAYDFIVDDEQ